MARKTSVKKFAKHIIRASKKKKAKPAPKAARHKAEFKPKPEKKEDYNTFLQNRIAGLEHELRVSEKLRQEEVNINKKKIEELYSEVDHLRERVYGVKSARQKRMEELEMKIRTRTNIELHKALEMESKLKEMQERYEKLKKNRKYPKSSLNMIKMAIDSLNQKIEAKKKEAVSAMVPSERHTLEFGIPAPKRSIPSEEIKPELPAMPSAEEWSPRISITKEPAIPKVPPELVMKPKKSISRKLKIFFFGKPKPRF